MLITAEKYRSILHKIRKTGLEVRGLETGITDLDVEMKLRLALGRFMVVTGIPGMGKSEVIDALVVNMAILHNWKTLYFSPENNPEDEHIVALVEKYVGKAIISCSEEECDDAITFLNKTTSWTRPQNKTIDNLLQIAKEKKNNGGLEWLIIDPWNYVTQNRGSSSMLHEHLSDSLNKITTFTREENVLVTVVAHPTNLPKDKNGVTAIPDLYTISDGAQWRNKCDIGIVVHRGDMSKNEVDIYLGKRKKKWMGRISKVTLDYDPASGRLKSKFDPDFMLPNEIKPPF